MASPFGMNCVVTATFAPLPQLSFGRALSAPLDAVTSVRRAPSRSFQIARSQAFGRNTFGLRRFTLIAQGTGDTLRPVRAGLLTIYKKSLTCDINIA